MFSSSEAYRIDYMLKRSAKHVFYSPRVSAYVRDYTESWKSVCCKVAFCSYWSIFKSSHCSGVIPHQVKQRHEGQIGKGIENSIYGGQA